jgi:hypothetical protein
VWSKTQRRRRLDEKMTMTAEHSADSQLYDRVSHFVASLNRTREPICSTTELARDLGLDGDDAEEFMLKFQAEFQVDLSDFRFDRHFGPEGFDLFAAIYAAFSGWKSLAPINVALLFEAAKAHRWPMNSQQ